MRELDNSELSEVLEKCCGSVKWQEEMLKIIPENNFDNILSVSEKIWYSLDKEDWLEAFGCHPKIGDINSLKEKYNSSGELAKLEQSEVENASMKTIEELAILNKEYENKFGYIFIICATGKSADEMLKAIKDRINNDPDKEIKIAMEEQNKITKLRLQKLL